MNTHVLSRTAFPVPVALAFATAAIAPAQQSSVSEPQARQRLAGRTARQQQFLFDHIRSHPVNETSADARFAWLVQAETAYAESVRSDEGGGPPGSRMEAFSPYIWSFVPKLFPDGESSAALIEQTHVEGVLRSLLADLEVVSGEREAGCVALLHYPSIVNGLARAHLLERVELSMLERMQAATERLVDVVARWKAQGRVLPRRVPAIVSMLQRFARAIDVEIDIREKRLEHAQAELSALAVPGSVPSGFRSWVRRLARAYANDKRPESALAVLDLGMLSTTEGSWPAEQLRALYRACGGPSGGKRFDLAVARRPAPLIPSSQRFDPVTLSDIETGQPLDVAALDGRPLLLDFVLLNCDPCRQAVTKLQKFQEEHPEVAVIAIASGPAAERRAVLEDIRKRGGRYPVVYATEDWQRRFGVFGYPSYVVVTANRIVMHTFGWNGGPVCSFEDAAAVLTQNHGEPSK